MVRTQQQLKHANESCENNNKMAGTENPALDHTLIKSTAISVH